MNKEKTLLFGTGKRAECPKCGETIRYQSCPQGCYDEESEERKDQLYIESMEDICYGISKGWGNYNG